jgi:hypothetical protein
VAAPFGAATRRSPAARHVSVTAWAAIAVATAYVLIATEWVHRVAAALGGASARLSLPG